MAGLRVEGDSGNILDVNTYKHGKIVPETDVIARPDNVGAFKVFSEVDSGFLTGNPLLLSGEVDNEYRNRVSLDMLLDEVVFNYTAQDTGKHNFAATTMAATWTAGQFTMNSGGITTITTGVQLSTYAFFPVFGTTTLSLDAEVGFTNQPTANVNVEWGVGVPGGATAAPADGVFFRLNSSGLQGIASFNGAEVSTGVFPLADGTGTWVYTNNKRYQFICYQAETQALYWVNDGTGAVLLGALPLPSGQSRMSMASGAQVFFKQRITGGAAGADLRTQVGAYNLRQGGANINTTASTNGNRILGSYQGLGGGTQGSLASYANSANPTAAAPSNTALTANLPNGLGGQGLVIAAAAAATDGIWASYQIPAGTVNVQGRRLVLRGAVLDLVNLGAAVATTATTLQFCVAFGHTAVSLATAEAATTKAPRRLAMGYATWAVGAGIGAGPQGGRLFMDLGDAPIFVNPGEFVQLVGKFLVGTATASQTIGFTWQPVYGWE